MTLAYWILIYTATAISSKSPEKLLTYENSASEVVGE